MFGSIEGIDRLDDQGLNGPFVSETNNSSKNSGKWIMGGEDRRVRRTKKMLKEALIELVVEKGYDAISVQDVIERADVGRTSFYAYFRSKDDLLLRSLDDLKQLLDPGMDQSRDSPWAFILIFLQHLHENRDLAKGLLGKASAPLVNQHLHEQILEHFKQTLNRQQGQIRDSQIQAAAVFASGALIAMIHWWLDMKRPLTPETMDALFRRLLLPGIESLLEE